MLRDVNLLIRKRGIALRSLHVKQRIRLYGIIELRLLSELLQGSETRAIALELRGVRNGIKSSRLVTYRFSWIDPLTAATLIAGAILLLNIQ
jgi:energy-coupling factor transporter transmembrane protein EcfT